MNTNSPDDDFVARFRESAQAAVPASTLDLDSVLRSSRRKHTTRRAGITLASTLALATVGAGVAGALPGIPGFWSSSPVEVSPSAEPPSTQEQGEVDVDVDPPAPSPTDIPSTETEPGPEPEARLAYLAPGVRTVADPATYRVDADTVVLDLGLEAGGGDRYLAVVTLAKIDGRHSATDLEVLAGNDTALDSLRAGNLGGTLLWRGVTSDAMVLPSDGGPALVFGFSSAATEGAQHLVFDDPLTRGAGGAQGAPAAPGTEPEAPRAGASLRVTPFDVLDDGSLWMRVLQVERRTAEPRGFIYAKQGTWSASWCRSTSPECAVIHDAAGRTVDTPQAAAPAPMVAELAPMLAENAEANEVAAMETCVAERTGTGWTAPPQLTGKSFWQAPAGVDADVWRLCLIDLSEALQHASTEAEEAPPGDDLPSSPTPSTPSSQQPTQVPEDDENSLGLGELLDGLFGS